jgi:hypothetical protein
VERAARGLIDALLVVVTTALGQSRRFDNRREMSGQHLIREMPVRHLRL